MPLQHHRGARGEEGHGARAPAGHADALARRRRGAARHQGLLRARRRVQGRRRRALRARRRATSACAGATSGGNGLVSVEYTFKGESAHAAGAPWRGRSALDAVELMDIGWNFRREHLRLQQRSHYVITNGGDQPNVVPPNATRLVLLPRDRLRAHQGAVGDRRQDGEGRGDDDRHRASTSRVLGSAWPRHFNKPIAEAMYANIEKVGLPTVDRGRPDARQGAAARAEGRRRSACATEDRPTARRRVIRRRGQARRRLRRHRRRLVERADGDARYPANIPGLPGPQLGERDRDGDADRAQGRDRRREGRRR